MNLITITKITKPNSRFEKISKNDTLYLFSSEKYNAIVEFASSNFYAPEFYYVNIFDKSENLIWSGGKAVFLDSLFSCKFLSNKYGYVVLNRVNDTGNSDSQQIVLVDLKTGFEKELTPAGFYGSYGHFGSFNAVFFHGKGERIHCLHLDSNKEFELGEILQIHFTDFICYGLCTFDGCILIVTKSAEHTLVLFDVMNEKVIATATIEVDIADRLSFSFSISMDEKKTHLTVIYSNKSANGFFAHSKTEYFEIGFS